MELLVIFNASNVIPTINVYSKMGLSSRIIYNKLNVFFVCKIPILLKVVMYMIKIKCVYNVIQHIYLLIIKHATIIVLHMIY